MANQSKPRRISVDIGGIEKELTEFADLAGIPEDVWTQMPDSQKLLMLAKRGIQATRNALAPEMPPNPTSDVPQSEEQPDG